MERIRKTTSPAQGPAAGVKRPRVASPVGAVAPGLASAPAMVRVPRPARSLAEAMVATAAVIVPAGRLGLTTCARPAAAGMVGPRPRHLSVKQETAPTATVVAEGVPAVRGRGAPSSQ